MMKNTIVGDSDGTNDADQDSDCVTEDNEQSSCDRGKSKTCKESKNSDLDGSEPEDKKASLKKLSHRHPPPLKASMISRNSKVSNS